MVRTYERKTTRQQWSQASMQEAVEAVVNGSMGYYKAARQFDVPQTTLERHVAKKRSQPDYSVKKVLGPIQCVFNEKQEDELVSYLTRMEGQLFGLTVKELCELAFQLAERNGIRHPFNKEDCSAGRDWVRGFMARNPTLAVRKPEATAVARAMGFNKVAVQKFFDLLSKEVDTLKLTSDRIFNVDETGLTVNPKGHTKIVALRGRRQVGTVTSAERGETVTAVICFSASGSYVPPMLIFPRKRMQQEFQTGLPPGATAEVHETGWINKELFIKWFQKFLACTGASKAKPVLLIFDGHKTHTKNLDLIDLARENGVTLICLPPHCSHRLQPLDVSYMKPLSKYYEDEVRKWLRTNPGKVVTLHQIASLFGFAYIQSATMSNALNGFRKCGIWPLDSNVFSEVDFLPSATTDIQVSLDDVSAERASEETASVNNTQHSAPQTSKDINESSLSTAATSSSSKDSHPSTSASEPSILLPTNFQVASPEEVLPIPKVDQRNKRKMSKRRGQTSVLTASPYKAQLMAEQEQHRSKVTTKRKVVDPQPNAPKKAAKKTRSSSSKVKISSRPSILVSSSRSITQKISGDRDSIEDDDQCLYCQDFSEEGWIRCSSCARWAHNSCAGVESDEEDAVHVCAFCDN